MALYLESTTKTGPKYKILSYDPATKKGKVLGNIGAEFETDLTKERVMKNGYRIVNLPDEES